MRLEVNIPEKIKNVEDFFLPIIEVQETIKLPDLIDLISETVCDGFLNEFLRVL